MDREVVRRLEDRTKRFAIDAIRLQRVLGQQCELRDAASQFSRAAKSVAANHRAMSRARSLKEFAAKLHIVHEEADECAHWAGVILETNRDVRAVAALKALAIESQQLRNLFGQARATTRHKLSSS